MNDSCFYNIQGIDVIPVMTKYLEQLLKNPSSYLSLEVPDKTRLISDKVSPNVIGLLYDELNEINSSLQHSTFHTILSTMSNMIMAQGA